MLRMKNSGKKCETPIDYVEILGTVSEKKAGLYVLSVCCEQYGTENCYLKLI